MKKLLLLSALLVSFSSFGQEDIKQGLVTEYYESGAVKETVNYADGKEQGEYIEYYESGEVKSKVNYVDGKRQGEGMSYYKSGAIEKKGNYISAIPFGDCERSRTFNRWSRNPVLYPIELRSPIY